MRKLYLLLDEWKNDRNFVGSELEEIKKHFDVTVICNDFSDKNDILYPEDIKFFFYKRSTGIRAFFHGIRFFFDLNSYREIRHLKGERKKIKKFFEIIRFYINGELFFDYLSKNVLKASDSSEAIFYSYWYFWKCFGITKHKNELKGSKVITRTHEYDLYTVSIPSAYQPFKYYMDDKLDKIIFIAEHGRQYYLKKYGKKLSDKYLLYHLGTKDYGCLNPQKESETIYIVSCSSVIPRKRVELIVDALSLIEDKNIQWIHFGTGDLFSELNQKAKACLGRKENIVYELKGYTNHEEIMRYYIDHRVDAFLMTAVSEGNPVSVIEAMSFGIPVISSNINNMPALVDGNGMLVSENPSPAELAEAILKLPFDKAEGIRSREIWEKDFQETVNNHKFIEEVLLAL